MVSIAAVIKNLETEKIQQEVEIQALNEQVRMLQTHIDNLEQSKSRLESRQHEHQEKNSEQFKTLQEVSLNFFHVSVFYLKKKFKDYLNKIIANETHFFCIILFFGIA